ncbi:beta-lactamase, partial [Teladorsagia circumcincta]
RNFGEGLERDGAAVAIYHRGKLVVDLWGGYADREANVVWKRNTRTVLFSATKAISALCIAVLVDRGLLRYEDRLVEFWPEYGCYGKENTTVEDVLSHKAGLPYLDEEIDLLDVMDFELIRKKIERSRPIWAPGTASGYHAVTFGFLVDGIVRHVDEKQRNLKTFFLEEIAQPHGLSVDIGVRKEEAHRVARVTTPSFWEFLRDCIKNPKMIAMLGIMYARLDEIVWKMRDNTKWLLINYGAFTFGHPGYGGQYVHVDPANQLVLAYLANGLKTGSGELCTTYMRLLRATYNALQGR